MYTQEVYTEVNGEKGPWVYESPAITMTVTRKRYRERANRAYTVADVLCRDGELFYSAAAKDDPSFRSYEMPAKIARRNSAVLGFTGDFLMHMSNRKGVMIRGGKVFFDTDACDTLAMHPDGELAVYPEGSVTAQQLLDSGVRDTWAFGPILIKDGEPYEPALTHFLSGNNRRCAVGMAERGHYIIIATNGYFTNEEMQSLFLEYGVSLAYSMDGGHSATLILMGEQLNAHSMHETMRVYQRPLGDMVLLGSSSLVPSIEDPVRYWNVYLEE
ncbi:MAG: phosphodiester glycosidase family protein [Christensenellales bacterium]